MGKEGGDDELPPSDLIFNPEATLATRSTTFFNSFSDQPGCCHQNYGVRKCWNVCLVKVNLGFALTLSLHQDAGAPIFGELF